MPLPDFSPHHLSVVFLGMTQGPLWDKLVVPLVVGAVSAAGSSYVTTAKLEERLIAVSQRLERIEHAHVVSADDRAKALVTEREISRLWEFVQRMEPPKAPAR